MRAQKRVRYFVLAFVKRSRITDQQALAAGLRSQTNLHFSHPLYFSRRPDGKKRTTVASMDAYIRKNGYILVGSSARAALQARATLRVKAPTELH